MEIRRGDIVIAAGPDEHTGKPRPFLIVQSDVFNDVHASMTSCPIARATGGNLLFRVSLPASDETGLLLASEVQADKMISIRRERIIRRIGAAPITTMTSVDDALRRWLEL
ncbi:type II toxin-antitoxin system PemK/MazF family toxin [Sphingomonas sp. R86520]|uniref:type II toxin-antitoxin system PemK/MazF family toxin n=1 Tax=Sphingomonas sp. R86520 TaxID=3093859 RepID=UPI0036D2541E